ncbi:hypothetical protein BS329_23505 [Amycolatopsis coloradensis]|uniref:Uncharacterized protein n=1 Tax=Amycolatopsis coloradensis TaxID=76021 RepID=A0A1R0KQG9_9PSEU|nr:hypothetical protein [Amycolatopsis coloradensis]OLZ49371.1 hypothetical protein BS329_23505 [Amycolatopsis coloradensis]
MSAPTPTVESPATGLHWYRITVKHPHPYEVGRILSEHRFVQARSPKEAMTRMPLHLRSSASVAPYQVDHSDVPDHSTKAYRAMLWTGRVMRAAGRWAVNKDAKALE